jgi:hypothetical protein
MHDLRTLRRLKFTIHKPVKLKTSLTLVASALLLASCGGGGSTTPPVDPLTLSLNLTGKSDNAPAVTSDTQLTSSFWGKSYVSGVLKADKTVTVTVTPEVIATMPKRTFQSWKDSYATSGSNCDTSKFVVAKDAEYFVTTEFNFALGGKNYLLIPEVKPQTTGTATSYNRSEYWYSKAPAEVSGTITCGVDTFTYALSFKPGWNVIAFNYSYDSATRKFSTLARTIVSQQNAQTVNFTTYTRTQ